jgi:hypothetical protein
MRAKKPVGAIEPHFRTRIARPQARRNWRAPRADGASVAQEVELDAGRVRGTFSPPNRDCARLGARRAPPRQGRPSAPNGHCKRPGCRGASARRVACFRLPVRWRSSSGVSRVGQHAPR